MDYSEFNGSISDSELAPLLSFSSESYLRQLKHGDFPRWRKHLESIPTFAASNCDFGDVVSIGSVSETDDETREGIRGLLLEMIPWRKGPFDVFGIHIDAEWRSNLKWNRLQNNISSLRGKKGISCWDRPSSGLCRSILGAEKICGRPSSACSALRIGTN